MPQIRIVPIKAEPTQVADQKGKLFELLAREIMRAHGYDVSGSRVNYAGMEIDLEGVHPLSGAPFIAECRARATPQPAPEIQKFVGKLWPRWRKNPKTHGIYLALPGINSPARGYVNEFNIGEAETRLVILEQDDVVRCLEEKQIIPLGGSISWHDMGPQGASPGDSVLLYTDRGYFWLQLLFRAGETAPSLAVVIDAMGTQVPDGELLRALQDRVPELEGVQVLAPTRGEIAAVDRPPDVEGHSEVASVKGSSSWFEYQFPASPEFFVGRAEAIDEILAVVDEVQAATTSSRGILIQGYSGLGKSSLILKLREVLEQRGCFVAAVDCRAASTPYFPIRAVGHALSEAVAADFLALDTDACQIGGMASARGVLERVNTQLDAAGKLLCIAFDQFEGVFAFPHMLENVARLASTVTDLGGRILLCFAWKTDLVGLMQDFPYELRDQIAGPCRRVTLLRFGETETAAVLVALAQELHTELRKDLAFLLRESSQGYPWLLKRLCAHVLLQRQSGITQMQLATKMLRVQELFDEDLQGLSAEEESALRHIAQVAPIPFSEVTETVQVDVLSSLIGRRLVTRVGGKCDIYWDIFRDYLNTGTLPVEESFILRTPLGSGLRALTKIREAGAAGAPNTPEGLGVTSRGTVYNILRDLLLLGLVETEGAAVKLAFEAPEDQPLERSLQGPLQEKMRRHRIVRRVLSTLEESEPVPFSSVADLIKEMCPYITADSRTWLTYTRVLCSWLDLAQIVTVDKRSQTVRRFDPQRDLRTGRSAFLLHRRKGPFIPEVQYQRLEAAMLDIGDAIKMRKPEVTLVRLSPSAWRKAVRVAAELRLLELAGNVIRMRPGGHAFIEEPEIRRDVFHKHAVAYIPAYEEFLRIVADPNARTWRLSDLGQELSKRLGTTWAESTATWVAKILANWARATGELPPARRRRTDPDPQQGLFEEHLHPGST